MNFKDASKIRRVVGVIKDANDRRAVNRVRTQNLFNGNPPWTEEEARDNLIGTNVNFLEGPKILQDARATWNNAFTKPATYFEVKLDYGPPDKRAGWGSIITKNISRTMKRSREYADTLKAVGAQVVLHGVGPVSWDRQDAWCPYFVPIEDIGIPTNTLCSLENLDHFYIYRRWTPAQLYAMTHEKPVDPGWNMKVVNAELKNKADRDPIGRNDQDYANFPERLEEEYKQNGGYYNSDAVTTVDVIDFFFKSGKGNEWYRRMLLDVNPGSNSDDFLFNPGDRPYAEKVDQLLHVQYGNCANVAPFRFHSVRSLGFMLYAVVHLMNRARCLHMEDLFRQLQVWLFDTGIMDRERIQGMTMHNFAFFPEGVRMVQANERYAVNHEVVLSGINQLRQLMSENSASFVQDFSGDQKEGITATEAMARVNSSNQLVLGMLGDAYAAQTWQYREISRRFCKGDHDDCKRFRQDCVNEGVPPALLNVDLWEVVPTRIVGAGNKTLQIAQIDRLMAARNLFPPDAQSTILRMYAEANADDPGLASQLVPETEPISDAVHWGTVVYSTLMSGVPSPVKVGINMIDYVETMIKLLSEEVKKTEMQGGMTTPDKVQGMQMVVAHLTEQGEDGSPSPIDRIAADPNETARVKAYNDRLGEIQNFIKAYAQRLEEAAQQQAEQGQGMSPEAIAKIEEARVLAESKARTQEELAAQKVQHKDAAFAADQQRRDIKAQADIGRLADKHHADKVLADLDTAAGMARDNAMTRQELQAKALKDHQDLIAAQKAEEAKKTKETE